MKDSLKQLTEQFRQWYGHRRGHSPVYETIIGELIEDEDLLTLVAEAGSREYVHYLFMGAVHYMVLEGSTHELRQWYGTLTSTPRPVGDIFPPFRDFCFQNKPAILALIAAHQVQINEVRRCTALLPAFTWVSKNADGAALALVDVGAAAGLNLLVDRFFYDYGSAGTVGDPASKLRLSCEPRGPVLPPVPRSMPRIDWRVGIDRQPVDVSDPHAVNWMIALVAPDDKQRLAVLTSALEIAQRDPPELIAGTACDKLPDLLARVPNNLALCVFHCFTTHHFTPDELDRFYQILTDFGIKRDFNVVSLEWHRQNGGKPDPSKDVPLQIVSFKHGRREDALVALVDWRGGCEWLEWLPKPA